MNEKEEERENMVEFRILHLLSIECVLLRLHGENKQWK